MDIQLNDSERTRGEVWTRVMGYHRPISSFNIVKQGGGELLKENIFQQKKQKMELKKSFNFCNLLS